MTNYYDQIKNYDPVFNINREAIRDHQEKLCKEMNDILNKKFGNFPSRWTVIRRKYQKTI